MDSLSLFAQIYVGVLTAVGMTGNVYCLRQLRTTNLGNYACSRYLLALIFSDTGFLLTMALLTVCNLGLDLINFQGVCQLTHFLTYFCSFLSNWYIAALSFERVMAVYKPFESYIAMTTVRSKLIVAIVTGSGLTINTWPLVLFDVSTESPENENGTSVVLTSGCHLRISAAKYYALLNALDLVVSCALPLTSIFLLNFSIVWRLIAAKENISGKTSDCGSQRSTDNRHRVLTASVSSSASLLQQRQRKYAEKRLTVFLLFIASSHLFLNLPSYVYRLIQSFEKPMENYAQNWDENSDIVESALSVTVHLIFYTQFSLNFLFYSLSGFLSKNVRRRSSRNSDSLRMVG